MTETGAKSILEFYFYHPERSELLWKAFDKLSMLHFVLIVVVVFIVFVVVVEGD